MEKIGKIYLAGGCFWGVDEYFSRIEGVLETESAYVNSLVEDPSYDEVCSGKTQAVEAVKITYDEEIISLEDLLKSLFRVIDPTVKNRQGADIGSQYRTGIYSEDKDILKRAKDFIKEIQKNYQEEIVTEVEFLKSYYPAEEYHQKYLKKNPGAYCHIKMD